MKETKGKKAASPAVKAAMTQAAGAEVDWEALAALQDGAPPTGFENLEQSDLGVPFLNILQPKSAEVDMTHPKYATKKLEGAKAGDIINSVSRIVLGSYQKTPILVVPCAFEKTWIEWKQRAEGGGLVKVHRDSRILEDITGRDENNKDVLRNGNMIQETKSFYVLLLQKDEKPLPAVINMSSTQLRAARLWLNIMTNIRLGPNRIIPPMYSHMYHLTTVVEINEEGSWFGWSIAIGDIVKSLELYNESKLICTNMVKAMARAALGQPQSKQVEDSKDEVI